MLAFSTLDWIVVAAYFAVVAAVVVHAVRQENRSAADYFLAGRHVGWFVIGASIFASNIGSEHIVGLAGSAAKDGLVLGHYELHSWLCLLLGWVFVPFYLRSRVFTMPEFLERRYGPECRWLLSLTMLVAYVLTKISVTVYAGAVVCEALLGIEFWTGALVVVLLTGVYTVLGGMRAVLYTEALQAMVLLVGSLTITWFGFQAIGGFEPLVESVGADKFNMFLPLDHPEYPWLGMLIAPPIIGLWYWCTDQYIVQRVLSAENETQARRGTIFAGYLKLLPFFLFMFPGLIAYGLANTGKLDLQETDQAFPAMVDALLPAGMRGLVAGGLLAALMSSLAAVFNSSSTLFTIDVYKKLHRGVSEQRLVLVGRIATTCLVALGLLWIPVLKELSESSLYRYLQQVQALIAPPIAAVFFLGLFWSRLNAHGALAALVSGFVLGMGRLTLEVLGTGGVYVELNFLYFAVLLFAVCVAILVGVSLLTPPPPPAQLDGLTYGTTVAEDRAASRASWSAVDVVHSVVIVLVIVGILVCFSPLGFG